MADLPVDCQSIQLRKYYADPLNVLQAELLHRSRLAEEQGNAPDPRVEQALMVTIAGVAAGMPQYRLTSLPVAFVLLFGGDGKNRCYNHFIFNIFPLEYIGQMNIDLAKHDPKIVMLQFLLMFKCYSWRSIKDRLTLCPNPYTPI